MNSRKLLFGALAFLLSLAFYEAQAQCTVSITSATWGNCSVGHCSSPCANASGGMAPYTYLWSTGSTNQCDTICINGMATVTVTDAN
ncbi:MAG: hypothetical protein AAGB22_15085, partial [Bacteroidota bacterium]